MRLNILFALLIFSLSNTYGQYGLLKGKVLAGDNPLEFANIGLMNTALGTSSDSTGYFEINNVPFGKYKLQVSNLGFETQQVELTFDESQLTHNIQFQLEESASLLEEVVVSGTMKEVSKLDSPVPVEVYSKKFFKANPTPSIFESLQNVNGVRPQLNCNVCNTGDIHINGLEGPYTMVLIDGMPIVSGLSTVYGLTGIPQSLIERVEIVKGPASTLYGSEAVGGLINIITKKHDNASVFSADVMTTSWGEINTDIGLKVDVSENVSTLLGLNYFNYSNPIDNNLDGFTDVTIQNRISVFNKWSFQQKNNKLFTIAGRYVYEDRWGGEMNWTPQYRGGDEVYGESIYTSRWETFGVYQLPIEELISFQFSANGHQQNSVYGDVSYIADQYIGFGQMTWNKPLGARHDLMVGSAYRYTYYDDNTPATMGIDGNDESKNNPSIIHLPGLFVQDEIALNTQNKLLFGLRYDYNSLHGNILTPRLNYKWSSKNKQNIIRLSAGNGYRVANVFTEDHAALTGAREVVFEGELAPERSWNANLNLVKKIYTQQNTYIGLDATAFYTFFNNRILPDYETDPNKIIYSNLDGTAVSKGLSLNVDIAFANGLKVLAGATVMDVSIEENGEREQQILTEQVAGVWSVAYTFPKSKWTIDYTGNLYGPMRLPVLGEFDDRPEWSPWWSIQNIQASRPLTNGWEIYFGVKNLLNYTPPANSIARAFDPFDRQVVFGENGQAVPSTGNPNGLTFDPSYVYAPNQGIRGFLGVRYTVR